MGQQAAHALGVSLWAQEPVAYKANTGERKQQPGEINMAKIFVVNDDYKADVKCFKVDADHKADLLVYVVKDDYKAT